MGILERIAGTLDELVAPRADAEREAVDDAAEEIRQARDLATSGELDQALTRLTEQVSRLPKAVAPLEARGELRRLAGDREGAIADFGRVVALESRRASAWIGLGEVLAELARWEPARDAFRRASTLPATSADERLRVRLGLGEVYARLGQPAKAIRELRRSVEQAPQEPRAVAALGRALLAGGDLEGADWLVRAARLPGGGVEPLIEAAEAKAAARRPADAEPPVDPEAAREADPALALLREAAARTPMPAASAASVEAALARRLGQLGDGAGALRVAAASAAAHPTRPESFVVLCELSLGAGAFAAAQRAARRLSELGEPPPFARWLAIALGLGDPAALDEALEHGQATDPGYSEARALRAGEATVPDVLGLARLGAGEAPRRFALGALAPRAPTSAAGVFGLLTWARDFASDPIRAPFSFASATQVASATPLMSLALPLVRAVEAYDRPLQVAVMGEFNAGKSSFVNALAGDDVARVGVTPTTATINILRYGPGGGGRVRFQDGQVRDLLPEELTRYLGGLDDEEAVRVRAIEVYSGAESLRHIEIVDTPGLNSLRPEHEQVARAFVNEADAVVWVFSFGQAAKASERAALELLHGAGKQVLGVVNKVDGATPAEIDEVLAHTRRTLGDRLARLVPFSARLARQAQRTAAADPPAVDLPAVDPQEPIPPGDGPLPWPKGSGHPGAQGGLPAVQNALDELFLGRARLLKQTTALSALRRFTAEAEALATGTRRRAQDHLARTGREVAGLRALELELGSALDAERVALRARIERAMRATAADVREFVRPGAWPFAEHEVETASEAALAELLDDAVGEAAAATVERLRALTRAAPGVVGAGTRAALLEAIAGVSAGFEAYVRGYLEGVAALFLRVDLPRLRLELPAIGAGLAAHAPNPDLGLFHPLAHRLGEVFARAQSVATTTRGDVELELLALEEWLERPLAALAREMAIVEGGIGGRD
jgi:Flp pilus assembly protein TadD/GTP-binding protein EngB required for normal cell division